MNSPKTRRPEAFTLIELLVVIAIIALLAGLAFPAVQGALNSGKKAQARNDMHQLAAAVRAFQLEYGRLPSTATGGDNTNVDSASVLSALTGGDTALNPRGIVFFEAKTGKGNKNGLGTDGKYYDPWGNAYTIALDLNYDNKINLYGKTNLVTVIVSSPGGADLANTNTILSTAK